MKLYHGMEELFHFAMTLLSRRRISRGQLEQYLLQQFDHIKDCQRRVQKTMERLEANGLINDEILAKELAIHYASKGDAFIRTKLHERAFSRQVIEATLESLEPEVERAVAAAATQWARYEGGRNQTKLLSFLQSRGFDSEHYEAVKGRLTSSAPKNH